MSQPKPVLSRAKGFTRRFYRRPKELIEDFRYIMSRRKLIRAAMRGLIAADFRERLMMVVTEVNGCRYCSYYHAKEALKSGIPEAELKSLLQGRIPNDTPPEEYPALVYAQHWAESNAQPSDEAVERLTEIYGQEKADAIHIVLRMIRVGNLSGNLFDYIIFKLTFGKRGLTKNEERYSILK